MAVGSDEDSAITGLAVGVAVVGPVVVGPVVVGTGVGSAVVGYEVNISNTGKVDSDHVLLGFLSPPGAGVDGVPLQSLWGFERVHVKAGESVSVYIGLPGVELTQIDAKGKRYALPGTYTVRFGLRETARRGF